MNEKTKITFEVKSDDGRPIRFRCMGSPDMRAAVEFSTKSGDIKIIETIRCQVEGLVKFFEDSKELCASLKVFSPGPTRMMRQCDLRVSENGPIFLKTFTSWCAKDNCWDCYIEGPDENFWESKQIHIGKN